MYQTLELGSTGAILPTELQEKEDNRIETGETRQEALRH